MQVMSTSADASLNRFISLSIGTMRIWW